MYLPWGVSSSTEVIVALFQCVEDGVGWDKKNGSESLQTRLGRRVIKECRSLAMARPRLLTVRSERLHQMEGGNRAAKVLSGPAEARGVPLVRGSPSCRTCYPTFAPAYARKSGHVDLDVAFLHLACLTSPSIRFDLLLPSPVDGHKNSKSRLGLEISRSNVLLALP